MAQQRSFELSGPPYREALDTSGVIFIMNKPVEVIRVFTDIEAFFADPAVPPGPPRAWRTSAGAPLARGDPSKGCGAQA